MTAVERAIITNAATVGTVALMVRTVPGTRLIALLRGAEGAAHSLYEPTPVLSNHCLVCRDPEGIACCEYGRER